HLIRDFGDRITQPPAYLACGLHSIHVSRRAPLNDARQVRQRAPKRRRVTFRRPKGRMGFWGHCRRLFWAWWIGTILAIWAVYTFHWGTAIATGFMAIVAYLITPPEASPTYGLDSDIQIQSEEFLSTIAGATGVSFVSGNRVSVLNNGDEFYP